MSGHKLNMTLPLALTVALGCAEPLPPAITAVNATQATRQNTAAVLATSPNSAPKPNTLENPRAITVDASDLQDIDPATIDWSFLQGYPKTEREKAKAAYLSLKRYLSVSPVLFERVQAQLSNNPNWWIYTQRMADENGIYEWAIQRIEQRTEDYALLIQRLSQRENGGGKWFLVHEILFGKCMTGQDGGGLGVEGQVILPQ